MKSLSAGLLSVKPSDQEILFLLVHPGGPFFKNKDQGFWTIPKGLVAGNENLLQAAIREFQEETGITAEAPYYDLGEIKQKSGKRVHAWSFKCPEEYTHWDPGSDLVSNSFSMEWPPRSGNLQNFPEIDRAGWFNYQQAMEKIMSAQKPLLELAVQSMNY